MPIFQRYVRVPRYTTILAGILHDTTKIFKKKSATFPFTELTNFSILCTSSCYQRAWGQRHFSVYKSEEYTSSAKVNFQLLSFYYPGTRDMLLHYTSRRVLKEAQASLVGFFFCFVVWVFFVCFLFVCFVLFKWVFGLFCCYFQFIWLVFVVVVFFPCQQAKPSPKAAVKYKNVRRLELKLFYITNIYTFLISQAKRNTLFGVAPSGP